MKRKISLFLALILAFSASAFISGCSEESASSGSEQSSETIEVDAKDLLDGVESYDIQGMIDDTEVHPVYNDFSVKLAQKCHKEGENMLVSPISVMYALSMAANGANGDTLSQIENTLGKDLYTLNRYLYFAMEGEYTNDPTKQSRANALWINNAIGYKPDDQYLRDIRTFYDADVFSADFSNATAEMSSWLSQKSGGKLTDSVTPVTGDDTMTLLNSLLFEAQWYAPFDSKNTKSAEFTCADGTKKQVDFMSSTESLYISDDKSTGFIKPYAGNSYGFMAILPNQGVSVESYLSELTGEKLTNLIKGATEEYVEVSMPKLEQSSGLSLRDVLIDMGIKDAFDEETANFTKMGKSDKTLSLLDEVNCEYINLDEQGVNLTAEADAVEVASSEKSDKKVVLNRPFIYMIIDGRANTTKFIGVYNK